RRAHGRRAGRRRAARSGRRVGGGRARAAGGRLARGLQAPPPRGRRRRHPPAALRQGAAAHPAGPARAVAARRARRRLMDVRLSPEQEALRDSVDRVVGRLGPRTVAELDDDERAAKLDAAVAAAGWRELRAAADGDRPLASAVEAALVAEGLARGLADAPFVGPTLAADIRRLAGAPPAVAPETVVLGPGLVELAGVAADDGPGGPLAVDAAGA